MTMTAREAVKDPYVTCESFCGKPIYDAETDHDPSCGAPPEERARLARELGALKIQAAANAEEEVAEVEWRCSCGETFTSQDDLAGHHTESGHQGMWLVEGEDETQDGVRTTVDGDRPAVIKRGPPREQLREMPPWRNPQVPESWIYAAQDEINKGLLVMAGLGGDAKCPGKEIIDGVEVECPNLIFARSLEIEVCDHQKKHAKTSMRMCLVHWVRYLAANLAPAGNGPLFPG